MSWRQTFAWEVEPDTQVPRVGQQVKILGGIGDLMDIGIDEEDAEAMVGLVGQVSAVIEPRRNSQNHGDVVVYALGDHYYFPLDRWDYYLEIV